MRTNKNKKAAVLCTDEANAARIAVRSFLAMRIPEKVLPKLREKYHVNVPDGATYGEMLEAKAKASGWWNR